MTHGRYKFWLPDREFKRAIRKLDDFCENMRGSAAPSPRLAVFAADPFAVSRDLLRVVDALARNWDQLRGHCDGVTTVVGHFMKLSNTTREWLKELLVEIGRAYIEEKATADDIITAFRSRLPEEIAEVGRRPAYPGSKAVAISRLRVCIDTLLPIVGLYSVVELERQNLGLVARILRHEREADRIEQTDPDEANLRREQASRLRERLPSDFVLPSQRKGRPVNPWRDRLFALLFADEMPGTKIARALGLDPAPIRRRRKAWRGG
jgi:hypothetical protein